jgi:hypothetical protein
MLRTVMDFSWGWVKGGPVAMTEPLVKAKLELARTAMQQATHRPLVASRLVLERREQRSRQRLRLPAACPP